MTPCNVRRSSNETSVACGSRSQTSRTGADAAAGDGPVLAILADLAFIAVMVRGVEDVQRAEPVLLAGLVGEISAVRPSIAVQSEIRAGNLFVGGDAAKRYFPEAAS